MTSVEYDDIYDILMKDIVYNNDDEYLQLMNKEKVVLETVNKVINQKEEEKLHKSMLDTSVKMVVYRTFKVINVMIEEIYKRKPLHEVFRSDRRLYIGLFIIFCCVCFMFLYKAG